MARNDPTLPHLGVLPGLEEEEEKATMEHAPPLRFGDWLVRRGLIDRRQLFVALNASYIDSCRIGDALVSSKVIARPQVENEATAFQSFLALIGGRPIRIHSIG